MLSDGMYVRLNIAPNTRMGTISQCTPEAGKVRFVFHHDPRFHDTTPDIYLFDYDVEPCQRPSDAEVERINELIKRGG